MDYLTTLVFGIIGGLLLSILLPAYLGKKREPKINQDFLATKEDIRKITGEIERLKHNFDLANLANAEREFYDENSIE